MLLCCITLSSSRENQRSAQEVAGHEPHHWGIEAASTCKVPALKDWLEERKLMQQILQQHLSRARNNMKT